ncbi:ABC transporter substrate-binding protein [Paenibacillus thermotolerans]|uniref:ABC transporter substrate-binding protein n=1 Tax=Paenibacillus thermotolerans TaxID=3027807 RepID=UPI002368A6F8|nr:MULTISPECIES: extracellular solute-binding protein [unclassified Paenibacillus]
MKPLKRQRFVRATAAVLATVMSVSLLAACTPKNQQADKTERVLRIATTQGYGPEDEWFRSQFTELYEFANPNVTIELVPAIDYSSQRYATEPTQPQEQKDPMEELKKIMQGDNPPDLVMVDYSQLPQLLNENLLAPLDPHIQKDKFDTSKIVPTVIDGIKDLATDGKLYALAPLFSSSALFYNKKIFNEAGVSYPTDGMTWQQVFDLAKQVSSGEGANRKYGFAFTTWKGSDSFWDSQIYSQPLQLRYYSEDGENMTVDTDQWETVWKTLVDLRKNEIIPGPNQNQQPSDTPGPFDYDNFLSGNAAMVISQYYYINELINAQKAAETNDKLQAPDWDVVTLPVHPEAPGVGGYIWMQGLMGINAKAQNPEDAWNFIKFLNGDDWARLKSRSQGNLVANKDYLKPKEGLEYNIDAFTQLKPVLQTDESQIWRKYPNIGMVQSIGQQKFQQVLEGKLEVRQALKEWQTEGEAMLKQMKENPDQPIHFGEKF